MTYEEAYEIIKKKHGLSNFSATLGPDSTPESLIEEFDKVMKNIDGGDFEIVEDYDD